MAVPVGYGKELALFQDRQVDGGTESVEWVEYRPMGQPAEGCPLEFNISGNTSYYLDLKNIRWLMTLKIVQKDGSDLKWDPPGEGAIHNVVCFDNMPSHSMWRQVDMSMQQKAVSAMGKVYPHKANLDVVTMEDTDSKLGAMKKQLYMADIVRYNPEFLYPDKSGTKLQTPGLEWRFNFTRKSQSVDLEGPLYLDLCQQDRYLLNGVAVNIKMWPSEKSFYLLSPEPDADKYKVVIEEAKLQVCVVKVKPEIMMAIEESLKVAPALYPYTRSDIRTIALPQGASNTYVEDVYQGRVPEQLIIAAVSTKAYNGSYKKSAFNYRPFDCDYVGFFVDGQSMPSRPLQMDFENGTYMDGYTSLVKDKYINIDRTTYPMGFCIYALDVYGKRTGKRQLPIRGGHTRLEIQFANPLPEPVTLILYGKFPACMKVDRERNVTLE